jgi:hypothetical protein
MSGEMTDLAIAVESGPAGPYDGDRRGPAAVT